MPSKKDQFNARISDRGKEMVYYLQERYGLSQSGLLEMLLRDKIKELEQTENLDPKQLRKLTNLR